MILDSIGPNKKRLITVEATYWRGIHAEVMTHRDRARNAASSRAIPWRRKRKKHDHESDGEYAANMAEGGVETLVNNCMFKMIATEPFIPMEFGRENPGMQTGPFLEGVEKDAATKVWLEARDYALQQADKLASIGVHKSLCNRLTEPFMWITILMTATEWKNFFRLRCHPMAEIHFRDIAGKIRDAIGKSVPQELAEGEWHMPYLSTAEYMAINDATPEMWLKFTTASTDFLAEMRATGRTIAEARIEYYKRVSAGRCARLSYLTHDGIRDPNEDLKLAKTLIKPPNDVDPDLMHASPFEHVAQASYDPNVRSGPFCGWLQMRKEFSNENVEG